MSDLHIIDFSKDGESFALWHNACLCFFPIFFSWKVIKKLSRTCYHHQDLFMKDFFSDEHRKIACRQKQEGKSDRESVSIAGGIPMPIKRWLDTAKNDVLGFQRKNTHFVKKKEKNFSASFSSQLDRPTLSCSREHDNMKYWWRGNAMERIRGSWCIICDEFSLCVVFLSCFHWVKTYESVYLEVLGYTNKC